MPTGYEEKFELTIPHVRYFGYDGFSNVGLHLHRHVETQYLMSGNVEFTVDGQKYRCEDGLLIVFPYQPHSNVGTKKCRQLSAIINPNSFEYYVPTFFDFCPKSNFIPKSQLPVGFMELMAYGFELSHNDSHPFRERLLNDVTSVIIGQALSSLELISRREASSSESISTIGRIVNYCVTHLSENLSLDVLSKEFFLDKSYISRLFQKKLGISYVEFITSQRVSTACEMLSNTSRPITEIAYDCGFRNQSSFNRVFRAHCGMTPSEYRQKHMKTYAFS